MLSVIGRLRRWWRKPLKNKTTSPEVVEAAQDVYSSVEQARILIREVAERDAARVRSKYHR